MPCGPLACVRDNWTCLISTISFGLILAVLIEINVWSSPDLADTLLYIATGQYQEQLGLIVDISHTPKPFEVCINDPESGDPCNGLARGDECFVGEFYLLYPNHCNRCCNRLYQEGSCTGNECLCYSNSGCIPTGV